jgi:apolipoprotein N-acyltransferase
MSESSLRGCRFFSWEGTLFPAALGALLYWLALPPVDWGWLGWLAPIPWILLVRREKLPEAHPYRWLWLVGFCFWMATYHFIRLPHPATSVGWVALELYQGFYLPIFVALVRFGYHRLKLSPIWVAPIVWTGLELARGHLITGVTMGNLGHTQYRFLTLIQLSDITGAYGLSFIVMLVAASIAMALPAGGKPARLAPLAIGAAVMAVVLLYGMIRIEPEKTPSDSALRVALIQGSIDCQVKSDTEKIALIHRHYRDLTDQACEEFGPVDLIVWPETMYRGPLIKSGQLTRIPDGWDKSLKELRDLEKQSQNPILELANRWKTNWLLGVDTVLIEDDGPTFFNSAALIRNGKLLDPTGYDKMHRVLFGEYVPLADWFPKLARLTPLPISLTAGQEPIVWEIDGVRFSPNICYESVLPHVIGGQLRRLRSQGDEPDILVNLTNDGWFYGSSELDMHLICGIFRAVEFRKPFLIAANTGFSAWIDADGRVRARGPRHKSGPILAFAEPDSRGSVYLLVGDLFAGCCLFLTLLLSLFAFCYYRRREE